MTFHGLIDEEKLCATASDRISSARGSFRALELLIHGAFVKTQVRRS